MNYKKIVPYMNGENELPANIIAQVEKYALDGADEVFIYNYAKDEKSREEFLATAKEIAKTIDVPFYIGMYIERFEDVKKAFYTGASYVVIKHEILKDEKVLKESTERFGKDKIILEVDSKGDFQDVAITEQWKNIGIYGVLLKHITISPRFMEHVITSSLPIIIRDSFVRNDLSEMMSLKNIIGVSTNALENKDIMKVKISLKKEGIPVNVFESVLDFSDFKLNGDGLIPVVTQDYKTNEVLMVAYMNEESFKHTLATGRMTYFSRSRQELWCKGDTSGHYQYVKSLLIDCDQDTLLAKVRQVGAACHTGNLSCFFTELVKKEYDHTNPLTVFNQVYDVIMDRKNNPKEGSYTNYLFEKGIDKILKKCGEEATEIVIAAKNPDAEELKYEIADFLYHVMVLMAECNLDWDDVVKELAHRR